MYSNVVKAKVGEDIPVKFSVVNYPYLEEIFTWSHTLKKSHGRKPRYRIEKNKIILKNVSVKDTGTYTISCRNTIGEGSESFVLNVTPPNGMIAYYK